MTKTMKTPTDMLKQTTEYFSSFPKTPEEFASVMKKSQAVMAVEMKNTKDLMDTYKKMSTGDATVNEIAAANKNALALATSARFATFMAIPGAVFALPALAKLAKEHGMDFVPESVSKEFNI
jgi:hypothetical protein